MKSSVNKLTGNKWLWFFLLSIFYGVSFCQTICKPEIIHFRRQSQVDSIPIIFKGCDYIDSTIHIVKSGITNVDSLYFIKRFKHLRIIDTNAENLSGLDGLNSIGTLEIHGNNLLKSLQGLKNIRKANNISIGENDSIPNLHGLNFDSIFGQFSLNYLSVSPARSQLKNLTGLNANFINQLILGNKNLEDLEGSDIKYLNWLKINFNNTLNKLAALNPRNILELSMSNTIIDISELNELLKIPGHDLKQLRLTHLPNLQNCAIEYICKNIDKEGFLYLDNLGSGCNSIAEIKAACLVRSEDIRSDDQWTVSPNPVAEDLIFLVKSQFSDFAEVEIINAQGVFMKLPSLAHHSHKVKADISLWPPGIYFYRIYDIHQRPIGKGRFVKL